VPSEFGTQTKHPGILLDIQRVDDSLEPCVDDVFKLRAMQETLELSTEQKRSTDGGIQILLELPVPKNPTLSHMYHIK
jgi:hypothetical protein